MRDCYVFCFCRGELFVEGIKRDSVIVRLERFSIIGLIKMGYEKVLVNFFDTFIIFCVVTQSQSANGRINELINC